jgi:hypothetical protein
MLNVVISTIILGGWSFYAWLFYLAVALAIINGWIYPIKGPTILIKIPAILAVITSARIFWIQLKLLKKSRD